MARSGSMATRSVAAMGIALTALLALLLGGIAATAPRARAETTFAAFLEALWSEARAAGISRPTFDAAFAGVVPDLTLPDLVIPGREAAPSRGQAEFTRPPQDYVSTAQIARLATTGRKLAVTHARALAEVEARIGIERAVVLAIWGRETAFGSHKSPHDALRVLATQAFTGRRKELFRRELIFALRLLQDGRLTRAAMRSSWAGAMGLTQFMPSEFYASGVDIDGDGRVDLFHSVADALGSAGRQLAQKGWIKGLPWGIEIKPGPRVDCAEEGPRNARPMDEWAKLGVVRADGRPLPAAHAGAQAYLMSPGGSYGPQFLVTENFKVIRAYNTSDLYALFVGHLSDRIAGGAAFLTPWATIRQLPTRDIEAIQRRLKALGHDIDKIDGKIGSNTRWQIGLFQRRVGMPVDCWPTDALLRRLQAAPQR